MESFPISGWTMPQSFLRALALVKEHAAIVNGELGVIEGDIARALAIAAQEVKAGKHGKEFPVDVFQTGSGTSTNMNMNEVIASLAEELLLGEGERRVRGVRGNRRNRGVHPNDHVNAGQSSNDVIPTSLQIAAALKVRDVLIPALMHLQSELRRKAKEFHPIVKTGRTHLMDAVPVRLGAEFESYATLLGSCTYEFEHVMKKLCILPLGGTAVGTGMNAHPEFAKRVIAKMAKETKLPFSEAADHCAAQSCPLACLSLSSALKQCAVALTKIANDIRLMASGPVAGLCELELPALQAGSSIMPGKVNPVLCESVLQVAAWVVGADATVTAAIAQGSNFELCTSYPLLASKILTSIRLLANASEAFAKKCIHGLKANKKVIAERLAHNPMLATALAPLIGYDAAANIAKEATRL
ncbi:MAG: class II fumarate hydratase, partial [Patescibacteria group bacterium]